MARYFLYVVLPLGLGFLYGCSQPIHGDVHGTVTRDGKPLPKVKVVFLPEHTAGTKAPYTSAYTDDNGRYVLKTVKGREGGVVGHYRVTIEDIAVGTSGITQPRVPSKYRDTNQTPLKNIEIKPGDQTFDFELK